MAFSKFTENLRRKEPCDTRVLAKTNCIRNLRALVTAQRWDAHLCHDLPRKSGRSDLPMISTSSFITSTSEFSPETYGHPLHIAFLPADMFSIKMLLWPMTYKFKSAVKNIPCKIVKYSKTKGLFDNNYWTFNKSSKWSGLLSFWASSNPIDPFSEVAIVYPLVGLPHWSSRNFESHCSSISSLCQHINITYGLTTLWPPKKVMFFNPPKEREENTPQKTPGQGAAVLCPRPSDICRSIDLPTSRLRTCRLGWPALIFGKHPVKRLGEWWKTMKNYGKVWKTVESDGNWWLKST